MTPPYVVLLFFFFFERMVTAFQISRFLWHRVQVYARDYVFTWIDPITMNRNETYGYLCVKISMKRFRNFGYLHFCTEWIISWLRACSSQKSNWTSVFVKEEYAFSSNRYLYTTGQPNRLWSDGCHQTLLPTVWPLLSLSTYSTAERVLSSLRN